MKPNPLKQKLNEANEKILIVEKENATLRLKIQDREREIEQLKNHQQTNHLKNNDDGDSTNSMKIIETKKVKTSKISWWKWLNSRKRLYYLDQGQPQEPKLSLPQDCPEEGDDNKNEVEIVNILKRHRRILGTGLTFSVCGNLKLVLANTRRNVVLAYIEAVGKCAVDLFRDDSLKIAVSPKFMRAFLTPVSIMFISATPVTAFYIYNQTELEKRRLKQDFWIGWWVRSVDTVLGHIPFLLK